MRRRLPHTVPMFATVVALTATAVAAPAASADSPVAELGDTALRADAGVVAWPADGGGYAVRGIHDGAAVPTRTVARTVRDVTGSFDVGRDTAGRATIVWADRCSSRTHRCRVRAVRATGTRPGVRTLLSIPYGGGETPTLALDGDRLAYTTARTRPGEDGTEQCDRLHIRRLAAGSGSRTLPAGGACLPVLQLDLEGPWLAVLQAEYDYLGSSGFPTVVRAIRTASGRGRLLDRETQGEESNYLESIAIDRGRVYAAHAGFRPENGYVRYDPATGEASEAHAFTTLAGGFARDGGRQFSVQDGERNGFLDDGCDDAERGAPCALVAGSDPWAGRRQLVPVLTGASTTDGTTVTVSGRLTRWTADRVHRRAEQPVAGAKVTLAQAATPARADLGTTTGPDGRYRFAVPAAGLTGVRASAGPYAATPLLTDEEGA